MLFHDDVGGTQIASNNLKRFFNDKKIFSFPKPVNLIQRLIYFSTKEDDFVLDFFAGSSTTAHAVMKMNVEDEKIKNRKFIMVQLDEKVKENSEAKNAGFNTIDEIQKKWKKSKKVLITVLNIIL